MAMLLTVHDVGAAFRDGAPRPHELERLFLGCILLEHWTRGHGAAL